VPGKWQTSVASAATISVNSTTDALDVNPGDGICADSSGYCTLRAAIMETNSLAGSDTISIPAGTYILSIPGIGEDASAQGDLDITDDLTVQGSGADVAILDGGNLDRIFHLPTASKVGISRLTVQDGNVTSQFRAQAVASSTA
jgi:CSLREA domain-containing protein